MVKIIVSCQKASGNRALPLAFLVTVAALVPHSAIAETDPVKNFLGSVLGIKKQKTKIEPGESSQTEQLAKPSLDGENNITCQEGGRVEKVNFKDPEGAFESRAIFCTTKGIKHGPYHKETTRGPQKLKEVVSGQFKFGVPDGNWTDQNFTAESHKDLVQHYLCDDGYALDEDNYQVPAEKTEDVKFISMYTCKGSPKWSGVGVGINYDTGKIQQLQEVKRELPDGSFMEYDANGKAEIIGEFKEGKETGHWKYFSNEKPLAEGNLKNGKKVGTWKYWENGKLSTDTDATRLAAKQDEKKQKEEQKIRAKVASDERKSKRDSISVCKCNAALPFVQAQIDRENEVGRVSGFVDKVKLRNLGLNLVSIREYLGSVEGRVPASDCNAKPNHSAFEACMERVADHYQQQYSQ